MKTKVQPRLMTLVADRIFVLRSVRNQVPMICGVQAALVAIFLGLSLIGGTQQTGGLTKTS
jgi:hypothetical protein